MAQNLDQDDDAAGMEREDGGYPLCPAKYRAHAAAVVAKYGGIPLCPARF